MSALALTILLAAVPLADNKEDQKALQGKWVSKEGPPVEMIMTIKGKNFSIKADDQEFKGTFTIDSSKSPKAMDLTITGGTGDEIEEYKGKVSKAIYEVNDKTFKFCAAEPGEGDRPEKFESSGNLNIVFEKKAD